MQIIERRSNTIKAVYETCSDEHSEKDLNCAQLFHVGRKKFIAYFMLYTEIGTNYNTILILVYCVCMDCCVACLIDYMRTDIVYRCLK